MKSKVEEEAKRFERKKKDNLNNCMFARKR